MKMMIDGVNLPVRKTKGSAGYDIFCPGNVTVIDEPQTLDTGILMEPGDIPEGYVGLILPRSSTGAKDGLHLRNTVGVIDSSYTMDTIKATIYVDRDFAFYHTNDRILQMVLVPYGVIPNEIAPMEERKGGYGSTGA